MINSNKHERIQSAASIALNTNREQQQHCQLQQQQYCQSEQGQQQGRVFFLDANNHLIALPTTLHAAEHNNTSGRNDAGTSSRVSTSSTRIAQYTAQESSLFDQQTAPLPQFSPSYGIVATNRLKFATPVNSQHLRNKNMYSNGYYVLNRSAKNNGGSYPPQYQPPLQPALLPSTLPLSSGVMITSQHPPNHQHVIRSQANSIITPAPDAPNQQPFDAAYRAIQDNGVVLPLHPAVRPNDGGLPAIPLPSPQYRHESIVPTGQFQTLPQPPVVLALHPRMVGLEVSNQLQHTPMNLSNTAFLPIGNNTIKHTTIMGAAARADRIARLTDLLSSSSGQAKMRNVVTLLTRPMASRPPGYFSYNNQANILTQRTEHDSENITVATSPLKSTSSMVASDDMQHQPALKCRPSSSSTRDWEANPAFSDTAATALHQEEHQAFPVVLHRVLKELERVPQGSDIAAFSADGKSFQIRNQYLFEKQILPVFFPRMRLFGSFQRQLNLYSFQRSSSRDAGGRDRGFYRHELFQRDCPLKSHGMKRTKNKGGARRASSGAGQFMSGQGSRCYATHN